MLISEKMNAELNAQAGRELGASNQYMNIAAYFDNEGLPELSAFFFRQSGEERQHALRFVNYVLDAGGKVAVPAIDAPPSDIGSAERAVQLSLDWEMEVTQQINTLMDLAIKQNDHITQEFLRWFVDEQLEEVSTMDELLSVVRRAGEANLLFVEQYIVRKGDPHVAQDAP
jgi:bacterioferritin B